MTEVLAASGSDPLIVVAGIVLGGWSWWNGRKTWRGEEMTAVVRTQRDNSAPGFGNGRRIYQTRSGAGHTGLVMGPGFLLISLGEGVRALAGQSREWWPFELVAWLGGILVVVGGLHLLWYFWIGVPDRLRPPCQRGWEFVDGEMQLVRPEAFHEHPKHSSVRTADEPAGYDPWR